jgi:HupE / UreJ protein
MLDPQRSHQNAAGDPRRRCQRPRRGVPFAAVSTRLLLSALLGIPLCATAHTTKLSSAEILLAGRDVAVVLIVNGTDLDASLGSKLTSDAAVSADRLRQSAGKIGDYAMARVRVFNSGGSPCPPRLRGLAAQAEHVRIELRWTCPPITGTLIYESTLFNEIDPATRQMVTVRGDARRMALLGAGSPRIVLGESSAHLGQVLLHYVLLGVEHIAIGYDHIAFLVAVILWGRRLWPLVGVVTAFTLAHSVTLSLAVLGLVAPPARLVEALIALSIVYVAAENFFVRSLRRRWILTFGFGLVHGFGFAGVLREYGIPQDALGWALAAFNVGVELGQIAVVATALAVLHVIETNLVAFKPAPSARLVYPISGVVLVLGLYWAVQRIVL